MANKLKGNSTKNPVEKPGKTKSQKLKPEKEEKINLKELASDERTWKIVGFVFLFFAFFLFIAFISYFFTWRNDQSEIKNGLSLFDPKANIQNLLGVLGAFISYFFIDNGFGVASLLICTFFFVVGVNLLFRKRVWSVWKNLRYVTIGMLVLSVCMAFMFGTVGGSQFPFGGAVGNMISDWLKKILGNVGTAALLLVVAVSYVIWQFNPAFNVPKMPKRRSVDEEKPETDITEEKVVPVIGKTINDIYAENGSKGNSLKSNGDTLVLSPSLTNNDQPGFQLIERDESVVEKPLQMTPIEEPIQTILPKEEIKPVRKTAKQSSEADIALEIKEFPKESIEEQEGNE